MHGLTFIPIDWIDRLYDSRPKVGDTLYDIHGKPYTCLLYTSMRYGNHPAVIGWQIDNEPGHYGVVDYSENAQAKFREMCIRDRADSES